MGTFQKEVWYFVDQKLMKLNVGHFFHNPQHTTLIYNKDVNFKSNNGKVPTTV